jgi:hypothetical protein
LSWTACTKNAIVRHRFRSSGDPEIDEPAPTMYGGTAYIISADGFLYAFA